MTCDDDRFPEEWYGDGQCDPEFNREALEWDGGDGVPRPVIHEIDPNTEGIDTLEFVELLNTGDVAVSLDGWVIEHINGANCELINQLIAMDAGAPVVDVGQQMVIGSARIASTVVSGALTHVVSGDTDILQNGPDAVVIWRPDGAGGFIQVDAVAWAGPVDGAGEGDPAMDDFPGTSLSRCPDGVDTDDNASHFVEALPTPVDENACDGDAGITSVAFEEVHGIFQGKCGPRHTSSELGDHAIGATDLDSPFHDSQLSAYDVAGTKGLSAHVRILDGAMPDGGDCGGPVADDAVNASTCVTVSEAKLIEYWIKSGQPGTLF